jgi:DNA-directed RNA polymerase sigma subunit (sigma70/sigma32)
VGRLVSLTKERIRQIERKALQRCHDVVAVEETAYATSIGR